MTEGTPSQSRRLRGDEVLRDPLVRELLDARLIGVLATLEPDGAVHAVPLWYAAGADAIVLGTGSASRKVRNLERDPRATLALHDSRPGFEVCGASILARAEIVRGGEAAPLVRLVHSRYVDEAALSLPHAQAFLGSDDVAIRLVPVRAFTWDERANPSARLLAEEGMALPLEPTASTYPPRG